MKKSIQIAKMTQENKEKELKTIFDNASKKKIQIKKQKGTCKLFFIPVIIDTNEHESSLTFRFFGSSALEKIICDDLGIEGVKCAIAPMLIKEGSIKKATVESMQKTFKWIENVNKAIKDKNRKLLSEPLPNLSYLVGMISSVGEFDLANHNWNRIREISKELIQMEIKTLEGGEVISINVLEAQGYVDALVNGTVEVIKSLKKSMLLDFSNDMDSIENEMISVNCIDAQTSKPVILLDTTYKNAQIELDLYRMGISGINKIMIASYEDIKTQHFH